LDSRVNSRHPWRFLSLLAFVAAAAGFAADPVKTPAAAGPVVVISFQDAVGPAIADYVTRGLAFAQKQGAQLVVLQMDTPGGLDTSMRQIIKDILASPVPVATFVSPQGARAASAGTYILYASHIAAMAPGTNLGAATPVQIGGTPEPPKPDLPKPEPEKDGGKDKGADKSGDKGVKPQAEPESAPPSSADSLRKKQIHDAAAYIRGLAQLRDRNAEWGEKAVREAVSLSAAEAVKQNVVDIVADDVRDLLRKLDGKKIVTATGERTLALADAATLDYRPDWRVKLLAIITNPSVAYILMLVGIYGLFFEFSNPGFVLPGVAGAICLLLAMFAFQLLPVNYAGLALIILGIAFMVGEAFVPSFGALGIGGLLAFVIGSVMLIDTEVPGFGIPWEVVGVVATLSAIFLIFVIGMALRARRRPVVSGVEEMLGRVGEMIEDAPDGQGIAFVHSELWKVRSRAPLAKGQRIRVTGMQDLILDVAPFDSK
jgi:membrane-bound serine protease (ClpP class)